MAKLNSLRPIEKINLNKVIVKRLTEFILKELDDGDKLPSEKELMENLHIGRSSLREALRAVEAIGMITVKAGSGSYVIKEPGNLFRKQIEYGLFQDKHSIEELIIARRAFDIGIIDLVLEKISDDDLSKLELVVSNMKESSMDLKRMLSADFSFHQILYRATGNTILSHISDIVLQIIQEVRLDYFSKNEHFQISYEMHKKILEALRNHSKQKLTDAIGNHNDWVKEVFLSGRGEDKNGKLSKKKN